VRRFSKYFFLFLDVGFFCLFPQLIPFFSLSLSLSLFLFSFLFSPLFLLRVTSLFGVSLFIYIIDAMTAGGSKFKFHQSARAASSANNSNSNQVGNRRGDEQPIELLPVRSTPVNDAVAVAATTTTTAAATVTPETPGRDFFSVLRGAASSPSSKGGCGIGFTIPAPNKAHWWRPGPGDRTPRPGGNYRKVKSSATLNEQSSGKGKGKQKDSEAAMVPAARDSALMVAASDGGQGSSSDPHHHHHHHGYSAPHHHHHHDDYGHHHGGGYGYSDGGGYGYSDGGGSSDGGCSYDGSGW
jgi:hypothetical protein